MAKKTTKKPKCKPVLRFLVVVRTNLDELPIRLCKTEVEAEKVILNLGIFEVRKAADLMQVDYAGLVTACVIAFVDGEPMAMFLYDLPDRVMNPIVGTGTEEPTQ